MENITKLETVEGTAMANKMLELGWVLVTTHTRLWGWGTDSAKEGDEYLCITLGWPQKSAPSYPPHFAAAQ